MIIAFLFGLMLGLMPVAFGAGAFFAQKQMAIQKMEALNELKSMGSDVINWFKKEKIENANIPRERQPTKPKKPKSKPKK